MMPQNDGLAARRAALAVIHAVLTLGETADVALGRQRLARADDTGLAQAIAGEVFRWLVDLDALIDGATRQVLPADAKARNVLRLMLVQALRLGTPPHAVIATGLPLLAGGPRRLAHGVFSALLKQQASLPQVPTLPATVIDRWQERAAGVADAIANPPPLDLTLRDPALTAHWAAALEAAVLAPGQLRLSRGRSVESLPGYGEGAWWVQDFAAAQPARLLGAGEGRIALDLCAAPGGKTLQLATAGWRVTALDASKRRLGRVRENLARTGLTADVIVADIFSWEPAAPVDAILLDAPCTATGTCRRHPDVLHRIGQRQIADLARLQSQMLRRVSDWLKPGARLIYAVCSMEREEGEDHMGEMKGLSPDPIRADELPPPLAPTSDGWLRTSPAQLEAAGGMDGFFAARFRRPD